MLDFPKELACSTEHPWRDDKPTKKPTRSRRPRGINQRTGPRDSKVGPVRSDKRRNDLAPPILRSQYPAGWQERPKGFDLQAFLECFRPSGPPGDTFA
jgi:hypothetical protein